jgi:hypothetical protein
MRYALVCLVAAGLSGCASAPVAQAPTDKERYWACAASADWLTRHAADYRNADTRRREQIENAGGDPAAEATRALCRDLFLKRQDDTADLERRCDAQIAEDRRRFGDAVAGHDLRLKAFCDAALNTGREGAHP